MEPRVKMRVKYDARRFFLRAAADTNEKRNHETSILNVRGSHKGDIQRTLNSRSP